MLATNNQGEKQCTKCKKLQPVSEFYKNRTNKDGLDNRCKSCKKEEAEKEKKNNYFQVYIRKKKSECIKKNIPFNLTIDYIKSIWTGKCAIINEPIYYINENKKKRESYIGHNNKAQLDRIYPDKGYVIGNVAWVSSRINRIKYNATIDELEKIVKYLKNHIKINNKERDNASKLTTFNPSLDS